MAIFAPAEDAENADQTEHIDQTDRIEHAEKADRSETQTNFGFHGFSTSLKLFFQAYTSSALHYLPVVHGTNRGNEMFEIPKRTKLRNCGM